MILAATSASTTVTFSARTMRNRSRTGLINIVDGCFNGGGQVAHYDTNMLRRPLVSFWATRHGELLTAHLAPCCYFPLVGVIDPGSAGDRYESKTRTFSHVSLFSARNLS